MSGEGREKFYYYVPPGKREEKNLWQKDPSEKKILCKWGSSGENWEREKKRQQQVHNTDF